MKGIQSLGGTTRASSAARGSMGQFLHETQQQTQQQTQQETQQENSLPPYNPRVGVSKAKLRPLTKGLKGLSQLPRFTEWWTLLSTQYPGVDLHSELLKAMDWHRADHVKSPKLYFRNWVEKTYLVSGRVRDLTPDEVRARLRVVR